MNVVKRVNPVRRGGSRWALESVRELKFSGPVGCMVGLSGLSSEPRTGNESPVPVDVLNTDSGLGSVPNHGYDLTDFDVVDVHAEVNVADEMSKYTWIGEFRGFSVRIKKMISQDLTSKIRAPGLVPSVLQSN